jgi:hypothetical protein
VSRQIRPGGRKYATSDESRAKALLLPAAAHVARSWHYPVADKGSLQPLRSVRNMGSQRTWARTGGNDLRGKAKLWFVQRLGHEVPDILVSEKVRPVDRLIFMTQRPDEPRLAFGLFRFQREGGGEQCLFPLD